MKNGWYYLAQDEADPIGPFLTQDAAERAAAGKSIAFDRASVRNFDVDGRLHVATANISKANICSYWGREIPDYQSLGLEPDTQYKLLRDPEELKKGAATFNNLQLLSRHVPVDVNDHQPDLVVGSTGTDATFADPYLQNSLVFWAKDAIDAIEAETQKELSSAYRYRADMTPGTFKGEPYDGVMRDIVGNHVALVKEGRAGSDVVVGDSAIGKLKEMIVMTTKPAISRAAALVKGALLVLLAPRIAQDAKIDFGPVLDGVNGKNFRERKAGMVTALKASVTGKLRVGQDANLEADVTKLLDAIQEVEEVEQELAAGGGTDADPNSALPVKTKEQKAMDAEEFLKKKLSAEDKKTYDAMCGGKDAEEESPEDKKKREDKEAADKKAKDAEMENKVDKKAMDAAIEAATKTERQRAQATREAIKAVRPFVGELAMDHDSPEAVYRTAIGALGIKTPGIDTLTLPALQAILASQPAPGSKKPAPAFAQDAASVKGYNEMFPGAANIGNL